MFHVIAPSGTYSYKSLLIQILSLSLKVQCVSKKMLLSEMRQFGHLKPICDIHYYLLNLHMIPGHV